MYKSTDMGETWQHIGLPKAGLIGKVAIHPKNADIVYVAALGNIFAPMQREVFIRLLTVEKHGKKFIM